MNSPTPSALAAALKISNLARRRAASNICRFLQKLRTMRASCQWARRARLRSMVTRSTRDKETYFIQRQAIGKIETESISRYMQKAETKFEANWANYEAQLEKYLTSSNKQYRDWMECKDNSGNVYWTHKNTLEESYEHPGVKVFQLNKKLLKLKAEEELIGSFKGVFARKHAIMETLFGLKHRIVTDLIKARLRNHYPTPLVASSPRA